MFKTFTLFQVMPLSTPTRDNLESLKCRFYVQITSYDIWKWTPINFTNNITFIAYLTYVRNTYHETMHVF